MTPRTIREYLDRLREAMAGDDPAVRQDALYDAEEYLRAELADQPDRPEAEVLAEIFASYGAPEEVAEAYRQTERTVSKALGAPPRPEPAGPIGSIFGVFLDPRTYAAIFYMLLALATGVFYFVAVVTGLSLSLGLAITIIGIPFFLLFLALVRILSLIEGRMVEAMLGVRMPRRPLYEGSNAGLLQRIGNMLTDPRTWSTMLYMVIQLPLGIAYFTTVVTGFAVAFAGMLSPLFYQSTRMTWRVSGQFWPDTPPFWYTLVLAVLGFVLLVVMMHLVRFVGRLHGNMAKYLLVRF